MQDVQAWEHRLQNQTYDPDACIAAIKGQRIPPNLGAPVSRVCVTRGILHHDGFACELRGLLPEFTRALNARAIMSNRIPDMQNPDDIPYCIWYPDIATEDTYRALFHKFPDLRYNIARACAVAGYISLYLELDPLPDPCIAEEAQDQVAKEGCKAIFERIIHQPVLYHVMNDYTRSVNPAQPRLTRFGLNQDTAVSSSLNYRRNFEDVANNVKLSGEVVAELQEVDSTTRPYYFNITEDWNVDIYAGIVDDDSTPEMRELLWNPLPKNLPPGNKDLLILMAAYHGDVDRYARLRRPAMIALEPQCITRGIYHNTMFAKWWSLQPGCGRFTRAINARFLMNNDLSRITSDMPHSHVPRMIFHPTVANQQTYKELVRRRPDAVAAVARACIAANYQNLWDTLDITPDDHLFQGAMDAPNPHYRTSLLHTCAQKQMPVPRWVEQPERYLPRRKTAMEISSAHLVPFPTIVDVQWSLLNDSDLYDGMRPDASMVELWASVADELRPGPEYLLLDLAQLYADMSDPTLSDEQKRRAYRRRGPMASEQL